jgi:mycofactocin precursor peptide peptidase
VGACLDELAWPAVADVAAGTILVVPLGSTEQHGPHLPVSTDTDIATALAARLGDMRRDIVIAPALPYGSSGEHAGFAGTLSVGAVVLEQIVVELVRSAAAFAGVVLVCGHGGNARPLASAVAMLRAEGRRVLVWMPRVAGGDAHAGRTETSLMLALRPVVVAMAAAEPGETRPIEALMPALEEAGVAAVAPNGVLGDPAGATAEEGGRLLDALATDLASAVAAWVMPGKGS